MHQVKSEWSKFGQGNLISQLIESDLQSHAYFQFVRRTINNIGKDCWTLIKINDGEYDGCPETRHRGTMNL